MAPQVGLEPTTLRLTARIVGNTTLTRWCSKLLGVSRLQAIDSLGMTRDCSIPSSFLKECPHKSPHTCRSDPSLQAHRYQGENRARFIPLTLMVGRCNPGWGMRV